MKANLYIVYKTDANKQYLESKYVKVIPNDVDDGCIDLENYTPEGGHMSIQLDRLTKANLQTFIDNYDINEEIRLWHNQLELTPFSNINDLYNDIEAWLNNLQTICDGMPY